MQALADEAHAAGAQFVVSVDPISLGLFTPPGEYGADIVTGEGQPMGNALSFGGPYLGFFAMKADDVRKSAGRIVGQTVDVDGKRGFVLTLSTREQHIRREKASSNICTNQALNALAAAIYMAAMGKYGLRKVAELCYHKAHYAAEQIGELAGYERGHDRAVLQGVRRAVPAPVAEINHVLLDEYGIIGGYDLGQDYPALKDHMLVCVTEMNTREIEAWSRVWRRHSRGSRAGRARSSRRRRDDRAAHLRNLPAGPPRRTTCPTVDVPETALPTECCAPICRCPRWPRLTWCATTRASAS